MIDLTDTTFIIPVHLESQDRMRNLCFVLSYITKNFNTNIIIHESDLSPKIPNILNSFFPSQKGIDYMFTKMENKIFYRTKLLNEMLVKTKTTVVSNYDCDVLLPISAYVEATNDCKFDYDLIYPFAFGDNMQLRVVLEQEQYNEFNLNDLKGFLWRAEHGFCQFFKTQSYIDGFMENENFISYGPEDSERAIRWEKLGYKTKHLDGKVYHLEHTRTYNSNSANPFMKQNEFLFEKLKNMNEFDLKEYYKSQTYYQNYTKS
jgi:hypothetical protein